MILAFKSSKNINCKEAKKIDRIYSKLHNIHNQKRSL